MLTGCGLKGYVTFRMIQTEDLEHVNATGYELDLNKNVSMTG